MADMISIIEKKKNGLALSQQDIASWVRGV